MEPWLPENLGIKNIPSLKLTAEATEINNGQKPKRKGLSSNPPIVQVLLPVLSGSVTAPREPDISNDEKGPPRHCLLFRVKICGNSCMGIISYTIFFQDPKGIIITPEAPNECRLKGGLYISIGNASEPTINFQGSKRHLMFQGLILQISGYQMTRFKTS